MTDQIKEIGMRLMVMREIAEISVETMAEKTGVSVQEYLAFEKGEKDCSISFLYNAAKIFGIDVMDLMSGDSPKLSVCTVVRNGEGYDVKRNEAYQYKHLAFTFSKKNLEPFLVTVAPSDKTPELNAHDGQEFNYILKGAMEFYIDDRKYVLEKGDSVYFDSNHPHAMRAIGDEPMQFLAMVIK